MKIQKLFILILIFVILSACSAQNDKSSESPQSSEENPSNSSDAIGELELTLEELKEYNGKDGNPAYIAVDGMIYDVTDVSSWNGGSHNGNKAGNELTDVLNGAPMEARFLKDWKRLARSSQTRCMYSNMKVAYMNPHWNISL